MHSILWLVDTILGLYMWVIIISIIMSWLLAFNVINSYNRFVAIVIDITYRLTEPFYRFLRRFIPPMGNIDFVPLVAMLLLIFTRRLMIEYLW
jgi:YggT family protein